MRLELPLAESGEGVASALESCADTTSASRRLPLSRRRLTRSAYAVDIVETYRRHVAVLSLPARAVHRHRGVVTVLALVALALDLGTLAA